MPGRRLFLGVLLWCWAQVSLANGLELIPGDRNISEAALLATQQLLEETQRRLPPSWSERLDRRVIVSWVTHLPDEVIGRATPSGKLQLNRRWLEPLISGVEPEQLRVRNHGGLRRELIATLIHELAHLYDRGGYWPEDVRSLLRACNWRYRSVGRVGLPDECRGQHQRQLTLSDDPRLLDLAGWTERPGGRGDRNTLSRQIDRTPDSYELTNPSEFVAVNLEYFLLDEQYACRRPALHRYFVEHFGWEPGSALCAERYPFVRAELTEQKTLVGWLDPERVYAVHYLLAEPNRNWASRWGHSMLRLVVCAPGRPAGPDCLLDLEHHLVVSFRAFVGDLQLSSWDGLTGTYPSRLFVLPLGQVVEEYTKLELRGLQSVPLMLNPAQRAGLVQQVAQLHWSYDGQYYFITNNCATETLRLLRVGTRHDRLTGVESMTPTGVLELLQAKGLADGSVLADRAEALRLGYYFDSHQQRYERMLVVLRRELDVPVESLAGWFALPFDQRRLLIDRAGSRAAAALLLLEEATHKRQLLLAQQELKAAYLGHNAGRGQEESLLIAGRLMRQLLGETNFLSKPAGLLDVGYGVPQSAEWPRLHERAGALQNQLAGIAGELENELPQLLDADRRGELKGSMQNQRLIADRLRLLHAESDGVLLP